MGFRLFSVYGAISCFSLWGSIFVNSAFKTFNTYSRLDLFYSRQTFLCVLAFNLLRQLPQSGIFHLSFVKPAHIYPPTRNYNVTSLPPNIPISNHKCSQKEIWEVGKVKIGAVGSGHCWSTMGPIYKKIHVINFIHFLLSARRGRT